MKLTIEITRETSLEDLMLIAKAIESLVPEPFKEQKKDDNAVEENPKVEKAKARKSEKVSKVSQESEERGSDTDIHSESNESFSDISKGVKEENEGNAKYPNDRISEHDDMQSDVAQPKKYTPEEIKKLALAKVRSSGGKVTSDQIKSLCAEIEDDPKKNGLSHLSEENFSRFVEELNKLK